MSKDKAKALIEGIPDADSIHLELARKLQEVGVLRQLLKAAYALEKINKLKVSKSNVKDQ